MITPDVLTKWKYAAVTLHVDWQNNSEKKSCVCIYSSADNIYHGVAISIEKIVHLQNSANNMFNVSSFLCQNSKCLVLSRVILCEIFSSYQGAPSPLSLCCRAPSVLPLPPHTDQQPIAFQPKTPLLSTHWGLLSWIWISKSPGHREIIRRWLEWMPGEQTRR